jgi:hypothetical protein
MPYYDMKDYKLIGYEVSKVKGKMYDAILMRKKDHKIFRVSFGSNTYENYQDKTSLNAYPHLIHGDKERRRLFRSRMKHNLKKGFYSPSYFSYNVLW